MPRRAAIITEADVTRAVKAARKGGAGAVEIKPDGTIVILIAAPQAEGSNPPARAGEEKILVF